MEPGPIGGQLLLQLIMILLSAGLSLAESSAHQLNLERLRRPANEDDPNGDFSSLLERLSSAPSAPRTAQILLYFFAAALGARDFVPPLSAALRGMGLSLHLSQGLSLLGVLGLLSFLYALLGVILPRSLALRNPLKTARQLLPFSRLILFVFYPQIRLLRAATQLLSRPFHADFSQKALEITENEIRMLVDAGEEKGTIERSEREMIENVFEFNNMSAGDCMTHRTDMSAIHVDDENEAIISLITQTGLSRFPVYQKDLDDIIGTISTREFLLNQQAQAPLPLRAILRKAHFVPESVRADQLFRQMQKDKYHMAIVVDEYGGTSGLITMEDLLEEIVGNIYDEYDPQTQTDFEEVSPGLYKAQGSLSLEWFNEKTGLNLPLDEDYDTLGGLILSQLGAIPADGSDPEIDCFGLHFKVLKVQDRRIEWVEVSEINED